MCGRFTIATPTPDLEARFGVQIPLEASAPRYNVAPTEQVLGVTLDDGRAGTRAARILRWGLIPGGARDLRIGARMINARAESVLRQGAFRALIGDPARRALVPADGWYEWLKAEDRRQPRQPYRFVVDGGAPFAFAGLWTSARIDGERIESFTIITCEPNHVAARVHDRMPVVLAGPDVEAAWLDPRVDGAAAQSLCVPLADERTSAQPANPRVNRSGPDNDDPGLLVPPPETAEKLFD
jgi:putative SOS response-associated peptidase YedK